MMMRLLVVGVMREGEEGEGGRRREKEGGWW